MTLVVMAAGMGSRYGGLKQLDPVGQHGEFIIDYSVFDAIRSGFDKVVFVIKEENLELFRETVGKRIEDKIETRYVFQSVDSLPSGFERPAERSKPWGTAHAVLAAKGEVDGPFAAINADDFYGRESFELIANFLRSEKGFGNYCMAGFVLKNTLTENGSVARGVCSTDENGMLTSIVERTKIERIDGNTVFTDADGSIHPLSEDATVSMNCWGFSGGFLEKLEESFAKFLTRNAADLSKCEFYLPDAVRERMEAGEATVTVLPTAAKWYGVTYRKDREAVVEFLKSAGRSGEYPEDLWKS